MAYVVTLHSLITFDYMNFDHSFVIGLRYNQYFWKKLRSGTIFNKIHDHHNYDSLIFFSLKHIQMLFLQPIFLIYVKLSSINKINFLPPLKSTSI